MKADFAAFLDELQNRISLIDIIGLDTKLKRRGSDYVGCCPFHKEKSGSFYVYPDNHYHCFGCGVHGNMFGYLEKKRGFTFMEAVEYLASQTGLTIPKARKKTEDTVADRSFEILEKAAQWMEANLQKSFGEKARDYIAKRGIHPSTLRLFRLGYTPQQSSALWQDFKKEYTQEELLKVGLIFVNEQGKVADRFRGRLMFPICDKRGRVIAFGGRILEDGQPKYLNSPDTPLFSKGKVLYAHHLAQKNVTNERGYLVVEGYMDVISLHQHGFKTAVAPLGTAFGEDHCALLWRHQKTPILCFDGDQAGNMAAIRAAHRSLPLITAEKRMDFIFLPKDEDPDSLMQKSPAAFDNLLKAPVSLSHVLWQDLTNRYGLKTPEEQAIFKKAIKDIGSKIQDPDLKQAFESHYLKKFNELVAPKIQKWTGRRSVSTNHPPIPKPSVKDSILFQKILLATLIMNPYLIIKVAEKLTYIDFEESLQMICDHLMTCQDIPEKDIVLMSLRDHGVDISSVLHESVLKKAPFVNDKENVEHGWNEIYDCLLQKTHLVKEMQESLDNLKKDFDEVSWNRIKELQSLKLRGQIENE
ncbi:MAG: DNA primase [Holosporales bacterium]